MNVIKPTEKKEGAGAKVKRLFPSQEMKPLEDSSTYSQKR